MFEVSQEPPSPTDLGTADAPHEGGDDLSTLEFCMPPDGDPEEAETDELPEVSSALVPIDQFRVSPMAEPSPCEYEASGELVPTGPYHRSYGVIQSSHVRVVPASESPASAMRAAAEQDVAYIRGTITSTVADIEQQTYVEMLAMQAGRERNEQRRGGFLMGIADVLIGIIQSAGGEDFDLQQTRASLSASLGHPCMTINITEPPTPTTETRVPAATPVREKRNQSDQVLEGDIIDPVDGDLDAITDGTPDLTDDISVIDGEVLDGGPALDGAASPLALEYKPITSDGLLSAMGSLSFANPEQESIMTSLFSQATDALSDKVPV